MRAIVMKLGLALAAFAMPVAATAEERAEALDGYWSIVIHGGAGTISRDRLTEEKDAEIRAKLTQALDAGEAILAKGGSATDAIIAAIVVLEDDPNFNAGKGAVLTWDGDFSLDSSIMEGKTRNAGAAAGASATKNPILLAREVMDNSRHVLLSGEGADDFSRQQGLEQVGQSYFSTPQRVQALEAFKLRQNAIMDAEKTSQLDHLGRDFRFGTVGAVALDQAGNIAAGTSTGGMTGKRWGRIGDSPIIGAGTYADNRSCGISATGAGEYFIRVGVAQEFCTRVRLEVAARLKRHENAVKVWEKRLAEAKEAGDATRAEVATTYLGAIKATKTLTTGSMLRDDEVRKIADAVIAEMGDLGGSGGVIYLTPWGHSGYSFDTPGMYRGSSDSMGGKSVAIYADE
jgi:beta-aspartyl-peptidase (threonine type)